MTNPQGTEWETWTVNNAKQRGIPAIRLVKQGQKNEADVVLGGDDEWNIPVLFWKRIVKTGGKVRQPLGLRYVAVLEVRDFLDLLAAVRHEDTYKHDRPIPTVWVQNKWAQQISVTKVLHGLKVWLIGKLAQR